MKAFYFSDEDRKLRYMDNRQIEVGETHFVEGEIEISKNGLHASTRLLDALFCAPGPILYHVELGGRIKHSFDDSQVCASERTYLAEFDATEVLIEFTRELAFKGLERMVAHFNSNDYAELIDWVSFSGTHYQQIQEIVEKTFIYGESKMAMRDIIAPPLGVTTSALEGAKRKIRALELLDRAEFKAAKAIELDLVLETVQETSFERWDEINNLLVKLVKNATNWDI
jgi:hypothetical protein